MGINFRKGAKPKSDVPPPPGRERLRHFDAELEKAHGFVAEFETRVARLATIMSDAREADQALQLFIANDGGTEALAAHAAGQTTADDEIAKLIAAAKSTSEAAAAAKAAQPLAQTALENARAQVIALADEKAAELNRVVMQLADSLAHAYLKSFEQTGRLYDQLLGFANGASTYIGEIALIIDPLKAPRFALPSLGNVDADPFIRHRSSELTVNESTETWRAVKARLELDVDADLSDLIAEGET
jgi:hypothetical protein